MAKVLHCQDIGMDCDFKARADTEEELLQAAAQHAKDVHNIGELTPELVERVRAAITDA